MKDGDLDIRLRELWDWTGEAGVVLSGRTLEIFRIYLDCLLRWNQRTRIVARSEPEWILCKHFADSLGLLQAAPMGHLLDLGSGGGFPGLVIAAADPESEVTLVDVNRKRTSFLKDVIARCGLKNARVVEARIEELGAKTEFRCRYDTVVARALAATGKFLELARPFLQITGRAVAMKGPGYQDEWARDGERWRKEGFQEPEVLSYFLPDEVERYLLVFRPSKGCFT